MPESLTTAFGRLFHKLALPDEILFKTVTLLVPLLPT